jgi:hypothetical protein
MFSTFYISASLSGQNALITGIELTRNLLYKSASQDQEQKNRISGLTPLIIVKPILEKLSIEQNIPISPILLALLITLISVYIYRKRISKNIDIISYITITHFLIYLTYSVVHTPHLTWILPLLLLLNINQKNNFYWYTSVLGIFSIIVTTSTPGNFDLSYFISPQFLWSEMGLRPLTILSFNTAEFAIFIALFYIYGIKSCQRLSEGSE